MALVVVKDQGLAKKGDWVLNIDMLQYAITHVQ